MGRGGYNWERLNSAAVSSISFASCLQAELSEGLSGVSLIFKCMSSKCVPQVPTKKLKKYEREYQTMRESQLQQEDPMDRYKVREMLCGNLFNLLNYMGSGAVPAVRQRSASHAHLSRIC